MSFEAHALYLGELIDRETKVIELKLELKGLSSRKEDVRQILLNKYAIVLPFKLSQREVMHNEDCARGRGLRSKQ